MSKASTTADEPVKNTATMREEVPTDAIENLKARLAGAGDAQPSAFPQATVVPKPARRKAPLGSKHVSELSAESATHFREDRKSPDPLYAYRIGKRIMMVPMWTGKLIKDRDGVVMPDVVMVACADHINDGGGCDRVMRLKGFKHCEDIPDDFAPLRDKLIEQRQLLIEREKKENAQKQELVKLGLLRRKEAEVPRSHVQVWALDIRKK